MMYEKLKDSMPEEYADLDRIAREWEELGTPLDIAQENRRRGAGPFINKIIEYMDKRFAMTVVMMMGCYDVDNDRPEVAMYVPSNIHITFRTILINLSGPSYERSRPSDRHDILEFTKAFNLRDNAIYKHQWRTYTHLAFSKSTATPK